MKKKMLVPLLMMLTAAMVIPATAAKTFSGQCGPELYWQKIGRTITITGQGEMWNYGKLDDCHEDETPFRQHAGTVNTVELPEGLTSIGRNAFAYQGVLYNFTIPTTVTKIVDCAFQDCCRYEADCELILPAGLSYIGHYAFSGCGRLVSDNFTLPSGLTYLGNSAFAGCTGLKADGMVIPEGIEKIEYGTFRNCSGLKGDLHIPAGVGLIDGAAFEGTKFTTVYFYGDAPDGYLPNGNYSVGLPAGAVLYYPADAAGWTDSEHYDAANNTWNGHEIRPWVPGEVSLNVEQQMEQGSAAVSVANYTPKAVNGILCCAAYSEDGKMLAVNTRQLTLGMTETLEIQLPLRCDEDKVTCVRAFFLDQNYSPITK